MFNTIKKIEMRNILSYLIAGAVFILDQLSKKWATATFAWEQWTDSRFFTFFPQVSKGLPVVLFGEYAPFLGTKFYLAVEFTMIVALSLFIWKTREGTLSLGYKIANGLMLGGALGNCLDRVIWGGQIDFLKKPTFLNHLLHSEFVTNLADVVMGLALLLYIFTFIHNLLKKTAVMRKA